jgi:hypothetical protein
MTYRMNEIVKMIRKANSVTMILKGEAIEVGFADSGNAGTLVMLGGGFYIVRTEDGRKFDIAKGELVNIA